MSTLKLGSSILLALAAMNSASAATLVVGGAGDPGTGDCVPFGCGVEYQQAYDAGLFPGTITITGLTFFNNNFSAGSIAPANYSVYLSTTTALVDSLSDVFADNLGPDNTLFFGGLLGGLIGATNQFTLTGTPFIYDPSLGNLLMSIQSDGAGNDYSVYLDFVDSAAPGTFGRAFAFGSTGSADLVIANSGLVTGFTYASASDVPEPGSVWLMLGAGGALMGLGRKRRRS